MVNPIKMNYSVLYILLLSAVLVAVAVATAKEYLDKPVFHWLGVSLYIWFSAVVVITLTALLLIYNTTLFNLDRTNLRNQLAVIQWLEHVSQGQPVLLIGPNHPIVVPDVTDIHAPWPYILWIENPYLRQRVTGLAESVLRRPPSVISVDPWSNHTRGLNIVEWFFSKGLINRQEIETIIDLIRNNYWQVQFPELQPSQYGRTYWVRKDLLDGNIPGRYTISSPQVGTYTFAK
jgi:hypothetical protein